MKRLFLVAVLVYSAAARATDTRVEVTNPVLHVDGTFNVAGAADTTGPNTTISTNSQCAFVLLTSQPGLHIAAGTLATTLTASLSDNATPATSDGNGNICAGGQTCSCTGGTYPTVAKFSDASGNQSATLSLTNPNVEAQWGITTISGAKCARVCSAASGTTGSAVLFLQATVAASPPPAAGADVTDRPARQLGVTYGSQGQQLKQSPTNFNAVSELAVGASLIDPRAIRALTSSDVVTANAGTGTFAVAAASLPLPTGAATAALQTTLNGLFPSALDGSGFFKVHEQGTATVAGTVTANIGTTNGLGLDATLTGGTQKAIARGGAKGASSAADVTSSAEGTDHQALDVQLWLSGSALDPRTRSWTLSSGTDSIAATQSGSWTTTVTQATGSNLHTVSDTGSTTAVTQATGSNLHAQLDTGSTTAVTQATGTNLHTVVDSAPTTATTSAIQDPAFLAPASTSAPSKAPVVMGKTADGTPQYLPLPLAAGGGSMVVSGTLSSAGAADAVSAGAPTTFNANSTCTGQLLTAGQQSAGFHLDAGTLGAVLTPQCSSGTSGTTNFTNGQFADRLGAKTDTLTVTNPNAQVDLTIVCPGVVRRVQVCTGASGTTGSATGLANAVFMQAAAAAGGGGGSVSVTSLPATPAGTNLIGKVGVDQTTPGTTNGVALAQVGSTATDTNSGAKSAGTLRVVLATDQPALTNKLLVTPDSVALPANQSVNESQINGVAPSMGNGVSGTGVQRVTIASDSTGQVALAASSAVIGHTINDTGSTTAVTSLPATPAGANLIGKVGLDQTTVGTTNGVSLAQVGAATVLTGNGTAGTGAQRVTIASDNTAFSVNATVTQATGTNLHAVIDSGSTTAVTSLPALPTGSNTIGAVTGPSAAALALDSSINALEVAQGSTTSGQKGVLEQCAVSTSAPTLTNGQTSPCSMTTTGDMRMVWSGLGTLQGAGVAGAPSGGVLTVQPPASGSTTFPISGSITPTDTPGSLVTVNAACSTGVSCAAGSTALVQLAGQQGANVTFSSGSSPTMTLVADCATDGGTAFSLTGSPSTSGLVDFVAPGGVRSNTVVSPGNVSYQLVPQAGCIGTTYRVRAVNTGGSINAQDRATAIAQTPYAGAIGASSYPSQAVAMMTQDSSTATTSRAARSDANGLLVSQPTPANLNATVIGGVSNDTSAISAGVETLPAVARASGTATTAGRAEKLQISSGAGGLFVEGPVANGATAAGNPLGMAGVGRATSAAPTQVTAGQSSALTTDLEHRLWVAAEHPNQFSCTVDAASAQTQCAGLSGSGLSYYIKSVTFSASAAITFKVNSSTTAGNACATAPALVIPTMYFGPNTGAPLPFPQPIKVTANSALCCLPSGASGSCIIAGYIAP